MSEFAVLIPVEDDTQPPADYTTMDLTEDIESKLLIMQRQIKKIQQSISQLRIKKTNAIIVNKDTVDVASIVKLTLSDYVTTICDNCFEFRYKGKLHDLPDGSAAVKFHSGRCDHYQHGTRHRDGGPAIIFGKDEIYYQHGLRDRKDGPAVIFDKLEIHFTEGRMVKMMWDKIVLNMSVSNQNYSGDMRVYWQLFENDGFISSYALKFKELSHETWPTSVSYQSSGYVHNVHISFKYY